MSDILIEKNLPSLKAFFAMARPGLHSTPYYIKRDNNLIPFWSFYITSDYPNNGYFRVNTRSADGQQFIKLRVLPSDEIYFTTNVFSITGIVNATKDAIYNYEGMTLETLSAFADANYVSNKNQVNTNSIFIRYNKNTSYKNTDNDKDIIKFHLQKKVEYTNSLSDEPVGLKNLLYFSLFNNPDYIYMLDICLKSINKFTPNKNFDILIITDDPTKTLISNLQILSAFNIDYMVLDQVKDPVEASAQKIRISEYNNINSYGKILFFDADIVTVKDLNVIFNEELQPNIIDVVSVKGGSPVSSNHSLKYFNVPELQYILLQQLRPFNAGHFLFKNSTKMQEHFKNVYWLYNVWPGAYFYEQSFMNYYFNIYVKIVSFNILNKFIKIGSFLPNVIDLNPDNIAIHFIGGGKDKLDGIKKYLTINDICL